MSLAYLATASPWVLGGDNGEFVTLFAQGGVAHPSGYPVYTLYLRALHPLLSWLPAPLGASLATALVASAAVAALYHACLAFRASPDAAVFAAGLFATSPLCWTLATHAEVFAPNALFAALLMLLCAPEAPWRSPEDSPWRAALLGLVSGLALANHLSITLLAPLGLVGLYLSVTRSLRPVKALALCLLGISLGLSSYLSLSWQSLATDGRWVWGDPSTPAGLIRHALRADYGSTRLRAGGGPALPLQNLTALVSTFFSQWLLAPALLGFVALARDLRESLRSKPQSSFPRLQLMALALSSALAGPLFVSFFNISPVGLGAHILSRFYLLPIGLFVPFVARGADLLARRLRPRLFRAGITLVLLASCLRTLPRVLDDHRPTLETYATDLLALCPPRAIVLVSGDHRAFGLLYAQRVLRMRRDVTVIAPTLLLVEANRVRYARSLGITLPEASSHGNPPRPTIPMPEVIDRLLATHRPVFVTDEITPGLLSHFSTYPLGPLIRVLAPGAIIPAPEALEAMNLSALSQSHLRVSDFTSDGWFAIVYADWARPWDSLARAYDRLGSSQSARRCRRREDFVLGRAH